MYLVRKVFTVQNRERVGNFCSCFPHVRKLKGNSNKSAKLKSKIDHR